MGTYQGRRDFRAGRAANILVTSAMLLFALGAIMTYRDGGWTWVSASLAGMTVLGVAGIIETFVIRVQLTDDSLITTTLRGHRSYAKSDIVGVGEGKGVPTSIKLADGRWVKLPSVGSNIGNSIRAWLKHDRTDVGTRE